MSTEELIYKLESFLIELHARILEAEALVGELRLREKPLSPGFREVDGQVMYSSVWLNDQVAS